MTVIKRKGRRLEPDKLSRSLHIAARVYQTRKVDKVGLGEARKRVAELIGLDDDSTIKRAWRDWKNHPIRVSSFAIVLEFERKEHPAKYQARLEELRGRIVDVKRNRGK